MNPPRFPHRHVLLLTAIGCAWMIGPPAPAAAGSLGALVPAYFYPTNGGVGGDWGQLDTAAGQISVTAIFNPDSGPGSSYNSDYGAALTSLEAAGGAAVGYVYTDYGNRPIADVEADINTYISFYGSRVDGFFLDQMSNVPSQVSYYQTLYTYIEGLSSKYQVIGNPGTTTNSSYLAASPPTANTFVTYEGDAANYTSANTSTGSPDQYANIVYGQSTAAGMIADVAFAAQNNVGYVYVTDQTLPNPYAQLPSYWDQEVAAIRSASVPEPGALILLASGCLLATVAVAVRRRVNGPSVA
jgi:hypothetical protein